MVDPGLLSVVSVPEVVTAAVSSGVSLAIQPGIERMEGSNTIIDRIAPNSLEKDICPFNMLKLCSFKLCCCPHNF